MKKIWNKIFKTSNKKSKQFYFGISIFMGIITIIGVLNGTSSKLPYDQRCYLLILSTMALILFIKSYDYYKEYKRCEKEEKDNKAGGIDARLKSN